ncbi:hypothetical protein K0M31_004336, partial [Melipona bicolor]
MDTTGSGGTLIDPSVYPETPAQNKHAAREPFFTFLSGSRFPEQSASSERSVGNPRPVRRNNENSATCVGTPGGFAGGEKVLARTNLILFPESESEFHFQAPSTVPETRLDVQFDVIHLYREQKPFAFGTN